MSVGASTAAGAGTGAAVGGPWGAAIGAGIGFVGGVLGQSSANRASANQSKQSLDWQAYQSNTAYRRSVYDLKKAGLNPMLAYQQGGASSGPGAQAQMKSETEAGINSAISAKQVAQQMQQIKSQISLNAAQAQTAIKLGNVHDATAKSVRADIPKKEIMNIPYRAAEKFLNNAPKNIPQLKHRYNNMQNKWNKLKRKP